MTKQALRGFAVALTLAGAAAAASGEDGRYIVSFTPGHAEDGRRALRAAGARVVLSLAPQGAVAARIPAAALPGLQHNPNVEYIEEDVIRIPSAMWNDVTSGGETTPYGIQMVQAGMVNGANAGNWMVCIIDSGYSQQHEDLKDADVTANLTDPGSGSWNQDSCGHGSHVAGTVSAISGNRKGVVGIAPGVKLHIMKVFGDNNLTGGNCSWTYSSTLVNALNKCVAAGAKVVSMSLGGGSRSQTEARAFASAYNQGVLSVAAAGNDGNQRTAYPAGYPSVISVAAVDADENVAIFSQRNADVELSAPGVGVLSTVPWLEINTLSAGGHTVAGQHIENSARTDGYGNVLVNGGPCTDTAAVFPVGAIVLCQRGTNTFYEKVTNVKNGGGGAAAIYNNAASDASCGDFAGTLGSGNSSALPAISMSCADGTTMLARAGQFGTLVSKLTVPASGYEAWSGTSMATPHVSGVAALVWSNCPGSTATQVRAALDNSAKDKGAAGRDNAYGYGIVQARAALDLMVASGTCKP